MAPHLHLRDIGRYTMPSLAAAHSAIHGFAAYQLGLPPSVRADVRRLSQGVKPHRSPQLTPLAALYSALRASPLLKLGAALAGVRRRCAS